MKVLKIPAEGLPLFSGRREIDFTATQRVTPESADKMTLLFSQNSQNLLFEYSACFFSIDELDHQSVEIKIESGFYPEK